MPSNFCLPPVEYSHPHPSRQVFPSPKAGAIADRGNQRRRSHGADPRDGCEPLASLVLSGRLLNHGVHLFYARRELLQF